MRHLHLYQIIFALVLVLVLVVPVVMAQTGDSYDLSWWTVDGGGSKVSNSSYILMGTAGQADAAVWQGGGYTLAGGFWGAPVASPPVEGYSIYLPLILK